MLCSHSNVSNLSVFIELDQVVSCNVGDGGRVDEGGSLERRSQRSRESASLDAVVDRTVLGDRGDFR